MKNNIKNEIEWGSYLNQILENSDHHAPEVEKIIPVIYEELRRVHPMHVMNRKSNAKDKEYTNPNWFTSSRTVKLYFFSYDHDAKKIVLKAKGQRGNPIVSFDNTSSDELVEIVMRGL